MKGACDVLEALGVHRSSRLDGGESELCLRKLELQASNNAVYASFDPAICAR